MSGYSGFKTDDYIYKPKGGFSGDFGSSNFKYNSGGSDFSDAAKGFLSAFTEGLKGRDKYREQSSPMFIGAGKDGSSSGGFTGGMSGELSFVPPGGPSFGGMYIPGQEGKKGFGSTIGSFVGTAASFIPGVGPALGAALPAIGGGAGSFFD